MLDYHFYIPEYNEKSNGIKSLWLAAKHFSKYRNVTVQSIPMGGEFSVLPEQFKELVGIFKNKRNTVVIYPDCISGNPLNARNVARFLMAKPYILNGASVDYEEGEFVFAYSKAVNKYLPQYNILFDEKSAKLNIKNIVKKNKVSIYYGKIRLSEQFDEIKNIINTFDEIYVITRSYPNNHEDMYRNIIESKLFISLDPLSHLSYEATLLGTPVYLADNVFREHYDNYNYQLYGFYYTNEINKDFIDTYDYVLLSTNTRKLFELEMYRNDEKTLNIILQIENFFASESNSESIKYLCHDDLDFFINNWKMSPIYNCTSYRSLIAYHAIRKSIYILLIIKVLLYLPRKFKQLVKYLKLLIVNELGYETYNLYLYLKCPEKYKLRIKKYEDNILNNKSPINENLDNTKPIQPKGSNLISTKLVKFLWRI